MRDPRAEELNTPEFNAIWDLIKHWDIGTPEDITNDGGQLYSGGTGSHVATILDALKTVTKNELSGSEALFGFIGWLTSRKEKVTLSEITEVPVAIELIRKFCEVNHLTDPREDWTKNLTHVKE